MISINPKLGKLEKNFLNSELIFFFRSSTHVGSINRKIMCVFVHDRVSNQSAGVLKNQIFMIQLLHQLFVNF